MSLSRVDLVECIFSFSSSRPEKESQIIEFLKQFGFLRSDLIQTQEGRQDQIRVYLSQLSRVSRLEKKFKEKEILQVRFLKRHLPYKAWAEKWKEDYQIQSLSKDFVVIPAWRSKEFHPEKFKRKIPIWIDPLSAFGSGEHETTQLIIRMLAGLKNKFHSFLDMGTGTGILSIVAWHYGARLILGFDNDKPSAECARFNFKQNKLEPNGEVEFFCAELARFKPKKPFDLVCANINSHILENYRKEIVRSARKGGWVLVSGILKQTYESFRREFDGSDLKCLRVLRGRRWVSVLYKKN